MAHTIFEQDMFIAAPPEIVQAQLARLMTDIKEMHPFVIATQHVKTTTSPDGMPVQHYRVRDRMKLGFWKIEFTYRVDMTVSANGKLTSNAYQSPGIHLYNMTWCEPERQGTRVREYIEITAPLLLMNPTYKGAVSAHKELFVKFKARVEQGQRSS